MTTPTVTPYFYILMRTDLASMNAGKAVAQGSHAAHHFQTVMQRAFNEHGPDCKEARLYREWLEQGVGTEGFGVAITLEVTGQQMVDAVQKAIASGHTASVITDPTYPIRDGQVTHLIPVDSCGYVFGDRTELLPILGELQLMGTCGMVKDAGLHMSPREMRRALVRDFRS